MLEYFCSNQALLNELNEKIKEVAACGEGQYGYNQYAQEYAIEFNSIFDEYKQLVDKLK